MPNLNPQLGSVVWAKVPDANRHEKLRPAVIVSPTKDIGPEKPIRLVAVTTRLSEPLPEDHVLLPWDAQGKARSGLRRKCAAVASWRITVSAKEILSVVGLLSPAIMAQLLATISRQFVEPEENKPQ